MLSNHLICKVNIEKNMQFSKDSIDIKEFAIFSECF